MTSTLIIGAGIIGCSTAYYLTEAHDVDPKSIHLIDSSPDLGASASRKAGGFLAPDWFSCEVAELGELSFQLHGDLADQHDGRNRWSYSPSTGSSFMEPALPKSGKRGEDWVTNGSSRAHAAGTHEFHEGDGPVWLRRRDGDNYEMIGEQSSVAQVDPLRLSQFLLRTCRERGVNVHHPVKIDRFDPERRKIVITKDAKTRTEIHGDKILIAAGAWTNRVFKKLFLQSIRSIPVSSLAGYSLVLRSPRWTTAQEDRGCHAVFSTTRKGFSPELFSRIGGELYVAGLNDSTIPLPEVATDARIDPACIEELKRVSHRYLGKATDPEDLEIVREGLCFRPVTPHGRPILSRIPKYWIGGANIIFVATGHGPWGISLSLGTGKVMADLIRDQHPTADISELVLD